MRKMRNAYSESKSDDGDAIVWVECFVVHTSKSSVKKGFGSK